MKIKSFAFYAGPQKMQDQIDEMINNWLSLHSYITIKETHVKMEMTKMLGMAVLIVLVYQPLEKKEQVKRESPK